MELSIPKSIVLFFHELVLFWELGTHSDKKSPTKKCGGRSAGHLGSRTGMFDPEKWCSFHADRATYPATL